MSKYKLIKEYPKSPRLGAIVETRCDGGWFTNGVWCDKPENIINYPEFWQMVKDEEYEILHKSLNSEILTVRRVNDGKLFSIGDRVKYFQGSIRWGIDNFYIREDGILLVRSKDNINVETISTIEHCEEPLFLDELGNEVFEEDSYYFVDRLFSFRPICNTAEKDKFHGENKEDFIYFKYEKDVKQYIEYNKPRFSKKQILDVLHTIDCDTNKESMILLYIKLRLDL